MQQRASRIVSMHRAPQDRITSRDSIGPHCLTVAVLVLVETASSGRSCQVRESGAEGGRRQAQDDVLKSGGGSGRAEWCGVFAVSPVLRAEGRREIVCWQSGGLDTAVQTRRVRSRDYYLFILKLCNADCWSVKAGINVLIPVISSSLRISGAAFTTFSSP